MALLALHVTPRSGKDEVLGLKEDASGALEVHVRVTAAPDGGKANKAVCKLLAATLHVPKSAVAVKRGDTSRHKILDITIDEASFDSWYASLRRL